MLTDQLIIIAHCALSKELNQSRNLTHTAEYFGAKRGGGVSGGAGAFHLLEAAARARTRRLRRCRSAPPCAFVAGVARFCNIFLSCL